MAEIKNPLNNDIIAHFTRLGGLYAKCNERSRSGTFYKVANLIAAIPDHITKDYDIKQHAGCGASTEVEIKQFLETGKSERMQELLMRADMPVETLNDRIVRMLVASVPTLDGNRVNGDLVLCTALCGLSTLEDYIANIGMFDKYMIDAGLVEILERIKSNPNS